MNKKTQSFLLGITGSFFFAFTFILNRSMNLSGGYWVYSAVLRYFFMLPMLLLFLLKGRHYQAVLADIRKQPLPWILWSTVGFGLFYLPLTAASLYSESWFTSAMWQITIVAGILLTPLFGRRIPLKNLCCSCLILAGIFLMQIPNLRTKADSDMIAAFLLILVGAFSYPLGNRKTMAFCDRNLSTMQRIFGMTLCSMPFWMLCGAAAFVKAGPPQISQCVQSLGVALFSGVIATALFFKATDLMRDNARMLAMVEATQCGEVIFTLLLGIFILKDTAPSLTGWAGIGIIVTGMILTSLIHENHEEETFSSSKEIATIKGRKPLNVTADKLMERRMSETVG